MKRKVVMVIEHLGDHYSARFPDYSGIKPFEANDASTLFERGREVLEERIAQLGTRIGKPQSFSTFAFSAPDMDRRLVGVIEVAFPD